MKSSAARLPDTAPTAVTKKTLPALSPVEKSVLKNFPAASATAAVVITASEVTIASVTSSFGCQNSPASVTVAFGR